MRSGLHPDNQDEQVRFRTTYYFRIVDLCDEEIEQDSLYRFRMTGKASALVTKIHFESGTLHKDQIDPFGATVEFDKEKKQFTHHQKQDSAGAQLREHLEDIKGILIDLEKDMEWKQEKRNEINDKMSSIKTEISNIYSEHQGHGKDIEGHMNSVIKQLVANPQGGLNDPVVRGEIKGELKTLIESMEKIFKFQGRAVSVAATDKCKDGSLSSRGFQIFGPQGWTIFKQDERLLMAMSTSAKPLISTMQEYSARILGTKGSYTDGEAMLPLLREQLRLSQAELSLNREKQSGMQAIELVDDVIEAFKGGE